MLLQDWLMVAGTGTTPVVQPRRAWLDLARCSDLSLWLEVNGVANPSGGSVVLSYETAPAADEALFQSVGDLTLAASSSPQITDLRLASDPLVPLGRWLRWKVTGTAAGGWSATIRVRAAGGRASTSPFTPAFLPLSGWWRAPYAGSPWAGSASAGASATRALTDANPPAAGSSVNGIAPADFNGTSSVLGNATTLGDFLGSPASAWTAIALAKMDSLAPDQIAYSEPTFLADSAGYWSLNVATSGARIYAWDGSAKASPYTPVGIGAWTMIAGKLDAGMLYVRTNGNPWSAGTSSGSPTLLSGTLLAGRSYDASDFLDGSVLELLVAPSVLDDATLDNVKSYFNRRYALSL